MILIRQQSTQVYQFALAGSLGLCVTLSTISVREKLYGDAVNLELSTVFSN
jgi:hypothetical protein